MTVPSVPCDRVVGYTADRLNLCGEPATLAFVSEGDPPIRRFRCRLHREGGMAGPIWRELSVREALVEEIHSL